MNNTFSRELSIRELKQVLQKMTDTDDAGNPHGVWVIIKESGHEVSRPVMSAKARQTLAEDGSDLILEVGSNNA